MSELNRLRELAALFRPRVEPIAEEAGSHSLDALDGIRSVVQDAIGDLEDKLGQDGALENLLDKNGLSHKLFISHLASGIKEYKKETMRILNDIERMLVDIEMERATTPSDDEKRGSDEIIRKHK